MIQLLSNYIVRMIKSDAFLCSSVIKKIPCILWSSGFLLAYIPRWRAGGSFLTFYCLLSFIFNWFCSSVIHLFRIATILGCFWDCRKISNLYPEIQESNREGIQYIAMILTSEFWIATAAVYSDITDDVFLLRVQIFFLTTKTQTFNEKK